MTMETLPPQSAEHSAISGTAQTLLDISQPGAWAPSDSNLSSATVRARQISASEKSAARGADTADPTDLQPAMLSSSTGQQSLPYGEEGSQRVTGMEKWEGRIAEIDDGIFTAELTPAEGGQSVVADFDLELLSPDEAAVRPGDVVYVTIRTVVGWGGHKTRTSQIRLRKRGLWTDEQQEAIQEQGRARLEAIERYID